MGEKPLIPVILATGFGSGYCPVAPGTAGALLATVIWLAYTLFLPPTTCIALTVALTLLFTVLGVWATNKVIPFWGEDPRRVVVDEMVGVWIPLIAAPAGNLWYALASFVLFRFFDIAKPLGVRQMERFPGGIGVMADDILAGIYSLFIIICAQWIL
ncbi:MAG: phosphatidylglycerophosphatase A [Prevotella sp.]|nr:phosphatidylglycerophosphatase A [Prevotella sp.]